jgi:hypothetical protein
MTPAQAVEAVLKEARRYRAVREIPKGSNRGVQIDYWIAEAGLDHARGFAWCAAYISQVGRQALGHGWPCPRTASVMAVVAWAKKDEAKRFQDSPAIGDLFVLWNAKVDGGRFAHIGFVTAVKAEGFATIEGNSNDSGGREGYGVFELARKLLPATRFVRWIAALA